MFVQFSERNFQEVLDFLKNFPPAGSSAYLLSSPFFLPYILKIITTPITRAVAPSEDSRAEANRKPIDKSQYPMNKFAMIAR